MARRKKVGRKGSRCGQESHILKEKVIIKENVMEKMMNKSKKKPLYCFYKIIHPAKVEDNTNLSLPHKFVRKFGKDLADFADLTVADVISFRVELKRSRKGICFDNGWTKVVDRYSIGYGSSLFFEYGGSSSFNVIIFDRTATEIEYPVRGLQGDERPDDHMCLARVKERRVEIADVMANVSAKGGSRTLQPCEKYSINLMDDGCNVGFRLATPKSKQAIRDATMLRPHSPFFRVLMRLKNTVLYRMSVPHWFVTRYLSEVPEGVKLQVPDGREWPISVTRRNGDVELGKGWADFVEGNKLKDGDVCVFELLEVDISFKVSTFPAVQYVVLE